MSCADVRLDEFLDGELAEGERRGVQAHLDGCAACREELERSRRLEKLLLTAAPAGAAPDADRFIASVRSRSRRWTPARLAVAAAAVLAILASNFFRHNPQDALDAVVAYSKEPSSSLEERIGRMGPQGLGVVESFLNHPDVKLQFAAATLLFKLGDAATRDRVLAAYQKKSEANGSWTLSDPGVESEDVELVPVAVSMAVEGQERWALDVLRRLNRLSETAQGRIIQSVVTLLKSDTPKVQKLALDIVKELEIEFPLSAIVDLLDSPELGDEALKVLREATRKDFGKDKEAWRKALSEKPVRQ